MTCSRPAAALAFIFACAAAAAAQTTIKFATLAPEGSTWMKLMRQFDKELRDKSGGALQFKLYPGGVQGDEKDVVSKMRIGQLQAAGLTGRGLGEVAPEVRVMDAPFLFRDSTEVDRVLPQFDREFEEALEKGGFVNLGWAEVGLVYIFSNIPIHSIEDARKTKMWVWEGDPIAAAAFEVLGVHPIPLSLPDVMTSLETGLVDAVYGSPMAVVALQWFTKTRYVYSVPLANASGAILISKRFFDALPPERGALLRQLGRAYAARITALGRAENQQALAALQRQGLSMTRPASPDALQQYEELGRKARRSLAGRLYPAELLERVEKAADQARRARTPGGAARTPGGATPTPGATKPPPKKKRPDAKP